MPLENKPWWTRLRLLRVLCFFNKHAYVSHANPTGLGLGYCWFCGELFGG